MLRKLNPVQSSADSARAPVGERPVPPLADAGRYAAAFRELEEETGYCAQGMTGLGRYYSSPGMVSEGFDLLRAEGLTRVGEGGGVDGEDILVHRVALGDVPAFVAAKRAEGCAIDVKLLLLLADSLAPKSS